MDSSKRLMDFSPKNLFIFCDLKELLNKESKININSLCDPSKVIFGFHVSSRSKNKKITQRTKFRASSLKIIHKKINTTNSQNKTKSSKQQLKRLPITPKAKINFQDDSQETRRQETQTRIPRISNSRQISDQNGLQ